MLRASLAAMRTYSPPVARRWLGAVRDQSAKLYRLAALKMNRFQVPGEGVHLSYAKVLEARRRALLQGGAVKLQHLQRRFPEDPASFNIVYLVSSALPRFAMEYVQEAKRRGAKFVWNQNGVAYPAWAGSGYEDTNRKMGDLLQLADHVVYQSEFCRDCADRFLGRSGAPWDVLYNCVDTDHFAPGPEGDRRRDAPVLLVAGTHQQRERVLTALETLRVLRTRHQTRFLLTIAGPLDWPGAQEDVSREVRDRGLQQDVTVIPAFDQKDAPQLYRSADILLHLKYKDPCPTVVVEAMACGIPVIGSNSGGMPELVGGEGGLLLDVPESWDTMYAPSADAVAGAVMSISGDLTAWSHRCRQYAAVKFDRDRWLAAHEAIFGSLVAQ